MDTLDELGLTYENSGACAGYSWCVTEGTMLTSINPANEQILATVRTGTQKDYQQIAKLAHDSFLKWRMVPAPVRGECIRLIAQELRRQKDHLGTLISLECGKIKQEGEGEVQEMIDMADFAVGLSRMLYGKTMQSERAFHRMYEQWHPLGPVGVITAFNFPVAVWAWNAFIAAICGNTVVWKPSHKVSLCAIAVQHICNKVMKELGHDGIFSLLIPQDNAVAQAMVEDKRFPLISFTGSTAVGKRIAQTVTSRLGRHILELSGNNAIIVDETANLALAIPAIVFGAVGTAGQRCTSTRRVIVHASRYDELADQLVATFKQIKIGDPLSPLTLMGPLIDEEAVSHYNKAIEQIQNSSAKILYGGKILDRPGYFVEPTLVKAQSDLEIVHHETFGPILYLLTYKTFPEAIAIQNSVGQGLSSSLFTQNVQHSEYFLSAMGSDCGLANVNVGTSGAEIGGAFGGEKETGGGREAGSDSWKSYMRRQTNTINWSDELPLAQGIVFTTPTMKAKQ
jgi:aldehyde dehydrogenase (NAD+)